MQVRRGRYSGTVAPGPGRTVSLRLPAQWHGGGLAKSRLYLKTVHRANGPPRTPNGVRVRRSALAAARLAAAAQAESEARSTGWHVLARPGPAA